MMEKLRQSCSDDTFQLFLEDCELLCEVEHNPFLMCLIEIRLVFVRNFIHMVNVIQR